MNIRNLGALIGAVAVVVTAFFLSPGPEILPGDSTKKSLVGAIKYSGHDRDLMIRTVYGEAINEPRLGQIAVAWVIRNRLNNPYGWSTIGQVVTACGKIRRGKRKVKICQFEPWLTRAAELMRLKTTHRHYRHIASVVDEVLLGRAIDPTGGAWYFLNKNIVRKRRKKQRRSMPAWSRKCGVDIGKHSFCHTSLGGYEANGLAWASIIFSK